MAKSSSGVESVEVAREKKDYAAALSGALAIWDETRAAVVADAIDAISAEARRSFTPPEDVRTNAEFQKRWLALLGSGDPAAVSWLAENLFGKLPGSDGDEKMDAFVARVRAVKKRPDPRIASALMTLVEQAPPIVNWSSDDCRKTLAEIGDARTARALDAFIGTLEKKASVGWVNVREKLPKGKPLPVAEEERWQRLAGTKKKTSGGASAGDRDALFQAVLDAPDDAEARAVLADCLQELGDPRGEFVSIQLAEAEGRATPEALKSAQALLKKHKKAWLGPLARVTYRAMFRQGFLDDLELDGTWKTSKKGWAELAQCPLLATVRTIHGKPTPDILLLFYTSKAMRSLRSVAIESDLVADAVDKGGLPPSVREIESINWKRHDHGKRFVERVLPLLEKHGQIDGVACTESTLSHLMKSKAFGRLTRLRLGHTTDDEAVLAWAKLPAKITTLEWGWDGRSELRRVGKGTELHLELGSWASPDAAFAKTLAKIDKLTKVVAEGTKKQLPALATALASLKKKGVAVETREPAIRSGRVVGMSG